MGNSPKKLHSDHPLLQSTRIPTSFKINDELKWKINKFVWNWAVKNITGEMNQFQLSLSLNRHGVMF